MSATFRRGLLAALAGAAALPVAPSAAGSPDAELIEACEHYLATVEAYNRDGGHVDCEDDPLWWAVEDAEDAVDELEAKTLAGVAALARVARWHAETAFLDDDEPDYGSSSTGAWPERVVLAVLRLAGDTEA